MFAVEVYAAVRRFVFVEGHSQERRPGGTVKANGLEPGRGPATLPRMT